MRVKYKTTLWGEQAQGKLKPDDIYNHDILGFEDFCCVEMKRFLDSESFKHSSTQRVDALFVPTRSSLLFARYCPFCGVAITFCEKERVTMVRKKQPRMVYEYEEKPVA